MRKSGKEFPRRMIVLDRRTHSSFAKRSCDRLAVEAAFQTNILQDDCGQIVANAGGKNRRKHRPSPKPSELEALHARQATQGSHDAGELGAIERERRRITRDIHDISGQYIVAALFRLSSLESATFDQSLLPHFADLRTILSRLSEELHEVAAGGRPAVPRGRTLVTALSDLTAQWEHDVGISARFQYDDAECLSIDDTTAETVFRICQEALTNIAKHAVAASLVAIHLKVLSKQVVLTIEDNGMVQNRLPMANDVDQRKHVGLAGMRERVAELGGDLTVMHRAEGGIRLVATLAARLPDALYARGGRQ
jgi:signal transduction histidine kinase